MQTIVALDPRDGSWTSRLLAFRLLKCYGEITEFTSSVMPAYSVRVRIGRYRPCKGAADDGPSGATTNCISPPRDHQMVPGSV
jgi:hypothetical protein